MCVQMAAFPPSPQQMSLPHGSCACSFLKAPLEGELTLLVTPGILSGWHADPPLTSLQDKPHPVLCNPLHSVNTFLYSARASCARRGALQQTQTPPCCALVSHLSLSGLHAPLSVTSTSHSGVDLSSQSSPPPCPSSPGWCPGRPSTTQPCLFFPPSSPLLSIRTWEPRVGG